MKTENPVNVWKEIIYGYSLINGRVKEPKKAALNIIFSRPWKHNQI